MHEVDGSLVGGWIRCNVLERAEEREAALAPAPLVLRLALLGRDVKRLGRRSVPHITGCGDAGEGASLAVDRLARCLLLRRERAIPGGNAEVGGALEDRQVRRFLRDDRDRLDRSRARADHGYAPAREVDAALGPRSRVVPVSREVVEAQEVGDVRHRQTTRRHDQKARIDRALRRLHVPRPRRVVPRGRRDRALKSDVAQQIVTLGDVPHVREDLRLAGIAARPVPLLFELLIPRI